MKKNEILVVEDNNTMRLGITESLKREGYIVYDFSSGPDAVKSFKRNRVPFAVIDLKMEPIDGLEVLRQLKEADPQLEVLMISAFGTVDDAVKAIRMGASDFLTKPFSPDELRIRVNNIFQKIHAKRNLEQLIEENRILKEELYTGYDEIVGASESIRKVFSVIEQVAGRDSTVLVYGESGTGKELIARAIHRKSRRSDKPFIKINCGALNDNLLESELFGHEKGAFTGAVRQKKGRFELADCGTLFLDEIGDISQAMQVKLLRVLQEGEFERVGGETTLKTDVRIIAATNRDLEKMMLEGNFREDLYYRLSVIPVKLPSLRERREDIPLLTVHFLNKLGTCSTQNKKNITPEGMQFLANYSWPGNIRELENLIERLYVISAEDEIPAELIASHLNGRNNLSSQFDNMPLDDALYAFEKNLIIQAMKNSGGVKNRAARYLKIPTSVLYYKLEKFGLLNDKK